MTAMPSETRDQIVAALRAGAASVRGIAQAYDVAPSTVSRIAKAEGIEVAPPEPEPVLPDGASARRSALAQSTMAAAEKVLASLDGTDWSKVPPDKRAVVFGILVDKSAALSRNEAEGLASVDAWLRAIAG